MDIQSIFYAMGIVYMFASFVFMISLIVLLLYIKNRVTQLQQNIQEKIDVVATVGQVGGKTVEAVVDKIREFIDTKNKAKAKVNKEKG